MFNLFIDQPDADNNLLIEDFDRFILILMKRTTGQIKKIKGKILKYAQPLPFKAKHILLNTLKIVTIIKIDTLKLTELIMEILIIMYQALLKKARRNIN